MLFRVLALKISICSFPEIVLLPCVSVLARLLLQKSCFVKNPFSVKPLISPTALSNLKVSENLICVLSWSFDISGDSFLSRCFPCFVILTRTQDRTNSAWSLVSRACQILFLLDLVTGSWQKHSEQLSNRKFIAKNEIYNVDFDSKTLIALLTIKTH